VDVPETRFADTNDGVHLAYKVAGEGALTLVIHPPRNSLIDLLWLEPGFVRLARRLERFARTVWYDRRGTGASGGDSRDRFVDEIADADVEAVLDSVGCEHAVLVNTGSGAQFIRYVAEHPERVRAFILINSCAHYVREDDYPWGYPPETLDRFIADNKARWGTGESVEHLCPSKANDEAFRAWWALTERLGAGVDDGAAETWAAYTEDVRSMLPTISVPTLVLHRTGNRMIRVGAGRYLGEHIPGAKYVELPGEDAPYYVGDTDALCDEIEEFLAGARSSPEGDVVTTTVLFTDIVASTEHTARLGQRKWSALIDNHDAMIRATLRRYQGHEIKTTGDGVLATFDATTRAIRAALHITATAPSLGIEVRAGVHTGEIETRTNNDLVGLPVTIAKRICDMAGAGEVLVSRAVTDLASTANLTFDDRGKHQLKGVPGTWQLFSART
jgi:class 3 adenylate cyclase